MTHSALALTAPPPLLTALHRELRGCPQDPRTAPSAARVPARYWDRAIGGALREFLERPGKEFRGEVTKIFFGLVNPRGRVPENLPLVVEALHAGSLVVDDIEDESLERRGGPALHRLCGVPVALNAGNWLYFWAAELLAELEVPAATRVEAHGLMARALLDCHYGQALDLTVRASELAQGELPGIVRATTELKTGSLLGLSAGLGALVGGAQEDVVLATIAFGRDLGTALQMLDDLSGIASPHRLHKGEEDLRNDRPTWLWAWLSETASPPEFEILRRMGVSVANGGDPSVLVAEMRGLLAFAKQRVDEHLETAFERVAPRLPHRGGLSVLRREIERLERSFV